MTIQDPTAPLRRVYVRAPVPADLEAWRAYGWRAAPDPSRAVDEHAAFRALLAEAGAEIVLGEAATPDDPDAIYAYDPSLITDAGAILLRPGKPERRGEAAAAESDLAAAGVPIHARMIEPGTAECGDMFWLDPATLLVGVGYRTNPAGVEQLRTFLSSDVEVVVFDLPHLRGPEACLHLMSFISPLAPDLAVGYLPMMPVRLVHLVRDRGITLVEVPDEEFDSMGPNVLATAPRRALALEGNPETRRRMEAAGVDVSTYAGSEISRKGDGGPTCLTKPLARG
ncbi:MAG: arginine deiminase [Actinobacteria bacterium]|nr:arginine deiminase [Actinomycetota bacterium]